MDNGWSEIYYGPDEFYECHTCCLVICAFTYKHSPNNNNKKTKWSTALVPNFHDIFKLWLQISMSTAIREDTHEDLLTLHQ